MTIAPWYHAFAVDGWERIVGEHLDALESSGLAEQTHLRLGVVGTLEAREAVIAFCRHRMVTEVVAEAESGAEEITLSALRAHPDGEAVCYAHTKGVTWPRDFSDAWRRSMTKALVTGWRECVALLAHHEAVGCHWLTAADWPTLVQIPFYGGNFWWTRRSVIERLPEPRTGGRHWAEAWLGSVPLDAYDLRPGWPGYGSFK